MYGMNPTEERTPAEVERDSRREGWDTSRVIPLEGGWVRSADEATARAAGWSEDWTPPER